jgi:iron complex transport system permease protein
MRFLPKDSIFYLSPFLVVLGSLLIGPAGSISTPVAADWAARQVFAPDATPHPSDPLVSTVVLDVRLPRILLAFLVGAALTASGSSLQALVRNPLVSPDILGLSAGAAFGAALALTTSWLPVQVSAFVFGLLAAGLSYFMALQRRGLSVVSLVLSGIIVSGIFAALLAIVQISNDPFKLQTIVHWTMGNLHNASWGKVKSAWIPIAAGSGALFLMRWRMNVLALGDEETRAVGLNPEREKILVLLPATLVASAAVAVAGIVGMVGLAVPHMIRMMLGPDNRRILPVSLAFGGTFLVIVDDLARAISTFEIPIGIFTTLIGGPFFIYLLKRAGAGYAEG